MNAAFAFLGDDDFAIGLRLSLLGRLINAKLEKNVIFPFLQIPSYPFSTDIGGRFNHLKLNRSEIIDTSF